MYLLIASPWQMGHATISISREKIQNPEIPTPTALKQNQSEFCIHMSSTHPSEKHEGLSPRQRSCKPHFFFNLLHLVINSNYWAITQKKNPLHCLFSTNWLLFQKYVPFQMRLQVSVSGSHLQSEQEGGETAFIWGFPQHLILCFLSTILPLIIS